MSIRTLMAGYSTYTTAAELSATTADLSPATVTTTLFTSVGIFAGDGGELPRLVDIGDAPEWIPSAMPG
jgi:hypothetical protein